MTDSSQESISEGKTTGSVVGASAIKRSVLTGAFWITALEIAVLLLDVSRQYITVRVLLPDDIGLMGIAMLQISVLDILTRTGFDKALIQRKDGVEQLMNVAWTMQIVRGILLAAVLAIAAPFISRAYGIPVLAPLLWVTCLHAFLPGLCNVGLMYYNRNSDFKTVFLISLLSPIVRACVVIPLVLIWKDVWALMVGLIAASLTWVIVSFAAHPFRPKLEWDMKKTRELFKFGKWVTGVSIMTFFILQGDALFVSGYFGTAALAFYTMSIDMATTPAAKITSVIGTVAFPAFARLQEKRAEMVALFEDSLRAIMLIAGPISIVIYAIVPDIVFHVIDEKWAPIIPLVRVLVVAGCLRAMVELGGPLFQAVGRGDLDFRMNLTRFLCTMLLVWPACAYGGLKAVAVVAVLGIASGLPIWFYGVKKILGLSPWYIIKSNILPCVCTATLGGTYALSRYAINGSLLLDLASSVVAIGLWIGIMALMGKLTPLSLFKEVQRLRHSLQAR